MNIQSRDMYFKELNERIKAAATDVVIDGVCGQRFIGSGLSGVKIAINGTPGNALGAYLDGATIKVNGNVQDAVGDTMNDGVIIVHGSAGDALGYAMRGGRIFIKGDSGYRTGIHMKEYKEKKPVIVIGGKVGSFLGEYLAGGLIIVLGMSTNTAPVGNFTGTGMHGGKIVIRTNKELAALPKQVVVNAASDTDMDEITPYIKEFAGYFKIDTKNFTKEEFVVLTPNAKSPYKQLYVEN